MICMKCGAELLDEAAFCKNCGTLAGSKVQKVNSQLYRAEKVVKEGLCNRIKNNNKIHKGKALLTNHRFVFFKLGFSRTFSMIFLGNLTSGDIYIPLSEIRSIKSGCQGTCKTIIISTKSSENYVFNFDAPIEWKNVIQKAIMAIKG